MNRAYADTDVVISLAKLKTHICAGITLSMKNLFGITPNSLYGDDAGNEGATAGRGRLHDPRGGRANQSVARLPGLKAGETSTDQGYRIPRIVTDICAACPIHLAIIDGITSMSGGEGPWCDRGNGTMKLTTPGVLIAGLNAVSTDAVGLAVMGFSDPRALRGTQPFPVGDNHLVLAERLNLGLADLSQIEVCGLAMEKARYPYPV